MMSNTFGSILRSPLATITIDQDGYISTTRTEDIICTFGYRLSTEAMEYLLLEHSKVMDATVFQVKDELTGEVPMGFAIVSQEMDGLTRDTL